MRFLNFQRTTQTMDGYPVRFDSLRRWEGGPPPRYLRRRPACEAERSLVLARLQGNLRTSAVARRLHRLFDTRGGAFRQDVLAATDVAASSGNDDFAASVANQKAEKQEGGQDGDGGAKEEEEKAKRGGQTLRSLNRKTGRRGRFDWRQSEYHLLPTCPSRGVSNRDCASASPPKSAIPTDFNEIACTLTGGRALPGERIGGIIANSPSLPP